jgi:hypothetical protein
MFTQRSKSVIGARRLQRVLPICHRYFLAYSRGLIGLAAIVALALACAPALRAQSDQTDAPKPVPVFSVGTGFISTFDGGDAHLGPLVSPVMLVPLGDHWLFESRATFESDLSQPPGSDGFKGYVQKEVDYAQLDFIANRYLTVTVGRFLTPFGIFNERLYPIWIRNLQTDPLILPIGTGPSNASTGGMLRGGFALNSKIEVNYAAYFSALSTVSPMDSNRAAGGRTGIYLPGPRIEFGGSFQRLLQTYRSNLFGFHFAWQPRALPLDLRAEYARSIYGSGYWVESVYRLSQVPRWENAFRRAQVVVRMQQFFMGAEEDSALPPANTKMIEAGLNYTLFQDFRLVGSYGRQLAAPYYTYPWPYSIPEAVPAAGYGGQYTTGQNANVWTLGFTYRFVTPLGRRE